MKRIIMHYDMDSFYASIEMKNNPDLKNKPMVVGQGIITTANYEARKFGIKSAMPVFLAKKLCPSLIVVPVNISLYHEISDQIQTLVKKITSKVEFIASDEGYLDISNIIENYPSKEYFGKKFKERIKLITGLTCSVGIGYNKLSAKIASDINKPDGLYIFYKPSDFIEYMKDKPIRKIPGIGKKFEIELNRDGIFNVEDIYKFSYPELTKKYSPSRAGVLYYYSRGIDDSEIESIRKNHSIGHENTYRYALSTEEELKGELDEIFSKIYDRLCEENFFAKTLTVKLKYSNQTLVTKSQSLQQLTKERVILFDLYETLFNKIEDFTNIKLAGLTFSNLSREQFIQLQL